ncbi:PT repeat [Methanospirillum hungatei JF-1]|uniref:PT repeat n=2 Tax=Methanospirillum hungatei TaxID=2203 RepID=Q2FNK1_METHJ|nr:PT repeat [Methanospirillum hungatei JF-1]
MRERGSMRAWVPGILIILMFCMILPSCCSAGNPVQQVQNQVVIFSGQIPYGDGNVSIRADSGALYQIPAMTPVGIIQALAGTGMISSYRIGDELIDKRGIFTLDGVNSYQVTEHDAWFVLVNGVQLREYLLPSVEGLNTYLLKDGDDVLFAYGDPTLPASAAKALIWVQVGSKNGVMQFVSPSAMMGQYVISQMPVVSTPVPTVVPVVEATAVPSPVPTAVPVVEVTAVPSPVPTAVPVVEVTAVPSPVPTAVPVVEVTAVPSPVPTAVPVVEVTAVPSPVPTVVPVVEATAVPSPVPTVVPVVEVTAVPSPVPTVVPVVEATAVPSPVPTVVPVVDAPAVPSPVPTAVPVVDATAVPSPVPTVVPVVDAPTVPSPVPTAVPVVDATAVPSPVPPVVPVVDATAVPSPVPTAVPVVDAPAVPSPVPTAVPVVDATAVPSPVPTPLAEVPLVLTPTKEPVNETGNISNITDLVEELPKPTPAAEKEDNRMLYSGVLALPEGTVNVTDSSGIEYEIPVNTPLGVLHMLLIDKKIQNLCIDDRGMHKGGILILEGINEFFNTATKVWFVRVNGELLEDYAEPKTDGLNLYLLMAGDTVSYYYGNPTGSLQDAEAMLVVTLG